MFDRVLNRLIIKTPSLSFARLLSNACARVLFFNKGEGLKPAALLKQRLWHRCFPVNFTSFQEHLFHNTKNSGAATRVVL